MQTFNNQRKLILLASIAGIVGIFLPWHVVKTFGFEVSDNGLHGIGIIIFLVLLITGGIAGLAGKQADSLDKKMWILTLFLDAIALLALVIFLFDSNKKSSAVGNMLASELMGISLGIGVWVVLCAIITSIVATWIYKEPDYNLADGFQALKDSITTNINQVSNNPGVKSNTIGERLEKLEKLNKMLQSGIITELEYLHLKSELLK